MAEVSIILEDLHDNLISECGFEIVYTEFLCVYRDLRSSLTPLGQMDMSKVFLDRSN